jgi:hypothetical protein
MNVVFGISPSGEVVAFRASDVLVSLEISYRLRKEGYKYVTTGVENPNHTGKMGVDVTGPEYDWKKRRI